MGCPGKRLCGVLWGLCLATLIGAGCTATSGPPTTSQQPKAQASPTVPPATGALQLPLRVAASRLTTTSGAAATVNVFDHNTQTMAVAPSSPNTTLSLALGPSAPLSVAVGLRASNPNHSVAVTLRIGQSSWTGSLPTTGSDRSVVTTYVRNLFVNNDAQILHISFADVGTALTAVDVVATADVPVVPYPTQVYFGGISRMEDLQQATAWPFVQANVDGFLFHSAAWGSSQMPVAQAIHALLAPHGAKFGGEVGGFSTTASPIAADWGTTLGNAWAGWVQMMAEQGGVVLDRAYINLISTEFVYSLCLDSPGSSNDALLQRFLNYEADYEKALLHNVPQLPTHVIYTNPVFDTWKGGIVIANNGHDALTFDPLRDPNGAIVLVDGKPAYFHFDSFDFLSPYFRDNGNSGGYETDSPGNYFLWFGPVDDPNNIAYRTKIYDYERWLHGMDLEHTFIVNTDATGGEATTPSAQQTWDQTFHDTALAGLYLYQRYGGRADVYNVESWYSGPYAVVPETNETSYTGLVAHVIKYLKGSGQKLGLAWSLSGGYATILSDAHRAVLTVPADGVGSLQAVVTNRGDVDVMPVIIAQEQGADDVEVRYSVAASDVTGATQKGEGYVFADRIAPGDQATMTLTVARQPGKVPVAHQVTLLLLHNPQVPSAKASDSLSLQIPTP